MGELMKRLLFSLFLIAVSILLGSSYNNNPVTANKILTINSDVQKPTPPVEQLASQFMKQLIQKTDEYYRVENFETKDQLINSFQEIASIEVASKYVNYYYYEEDGSLYIVPTETPPWFEQGNSYTLMEVTKGHYRLSQRNFSEIHGNYIIHIDYKYENGKWRINDVIYE
jgi:hypothetical protein